VGGCTSPAVGLGGSTPRKRLVKILHFGSFWVKNVLLNAGQKHQHHITQTLLGGHWSEI